MLILTWLLTFILVLDCLVLGLLVLIQLPKKEAGMGQAFGGSTTDALFGAGSGTALTKMTKYTAGIFFVLTLLLAVMHGQASRSHSGDLRARLTPEDKLGQVMPTNPPANKTITTNINLSAALTNALTNLVSTNIKATPTAAPLEKTNK